MKTNMKTNKGSIILILGVVVVLAVLGGGFAYYQNSSKTSNDSMNTDTASTSGIGDVFKSITQTTSNMSPKEIFLARNTEMYNAQSFEAVVAVSEKYDTQAEIKDNQEKFKNLTGERRDTFFSFLQGMMVPTEQLTEIQEVITGDTAKVSAYNPTKKQEHTATFIKENGSWKMSESKILLNPR